MDESPVENKIHEVTPKELPIYRFCHPYGNISIYCSSGQTPSPERVYMLLEQAKHDLLAQHLYSVQNPLNEV